MTGSGFVHYILPVVPPLSLLAGMEIDALRAGWSQRRTGKSGMVFAAVLIVAALINSALVNGEVYRDYAAYVLGRISYTGFLTRHMEAGRLHLQLSEIAAYIRARTTPDDRVYYWGSAVQFYYLVDRTCPVENIWPYYAEAFPPSQDAFGLKTPYIIMGDTWMAEPPAWLNAQLGQHYVLETTIEGEAIYRYAGK
jgi:hypothetical protein